MAETLIELARRLRPYIVKAAQSLSDADAVKAADLYDEWTAGVQYAAGYKVRRGGKVYSCLQAHASQTGWEPETAAALWHEINETNAGTIDDPIPYSGNMALVAGQYYSQGGVIYRCTLDTVNPVYHALADLVGLYVEVSA